MKAIEKEIEYYKEISGRLTTALFLTAGGTVAVMRRSGLETWTFVGALTTILIALVLFSIMGKWKRKIEELKSYADRD